jgi:hypothetical protein
MDIQTIATLIGTLGFPIVACCGMAYFFAKVNDNYRNDIKEIQANHKEEIAGMTEAINNNTLVIQKLVDKMDEG